MTTSPSVSASRPLVVDQDTLNDELQLHLTAKDVENNPKFANLLQALTHILTPEGRSCDILRDLHQAEEKLQYEKHEWLQSHILHRELQEIILDYELQAHDTALSTADKEFKEILEQSLTYAETFDYLLFNPDPSSQVTLLGLSPEDIESHNPYNMHLPSLQQKLIPDLENRLRQRCENLVGVFCSSYLRAESSTLTMAKSTQLPALVERSQALLDENRKQLKQIRSMREKQFWRYFHTLLESLSILDKMVNTYRLGKQSQYTSITADWLAARCDAMCFKIKYVELQVLCDTYSAEAVNALRKVKQHLSEATEEKERDLHRIALALNAYAAIGSGFDELVEEYGKLKAEMDNKRWALQEFQRTN
ncbi:HAUS augmin-like complex subunit 4 isoform X2 [Pomacea canaliculata]|uniref:HAUS augmin-like complex subunit 4 isoform X2 n=1 Tax=Pomacea canaliculata TaxID=400727 RepID=UPI000D72D446|nr:HAUS augmin-like complex subunit 4 isoform X2 [Pomacea canaliculata]